MDKWEEALEKHEETLDEILKGHPWSLTRTVDLAALSSHGHKGVYELRLMNGNELVAKFALEPIPWCHGMCVSGASEVNEKWRGKGLGKALNKLRQDIARAYGYSSMLCTAVWENVAQHKVLEGTGWEKVWNFNNQRTKHTVGVWMLNL